MKIIIFKISLIISVKIEQEQEVETIKLKKIFVKIFFLGPEYKILFRL